MSADVTLFEAITALVADKRAVGYKYDADLALLAEVSPKSQSRRQRSTTG